MAVTSGAKIQIDKETKMIKISGFKDKVETAKHMLETFMADYVPRDQQYQKSDTATTTTVAGTGAAVFGQTSEQQKAAAARRSCVETRRGREAVVGDTSKPRRVHVLLQHNDW